MPWEVPGAPKLEDFGLQAPRPGTRKHDKEYPRLDQAQDMQPDVDYHTKVPSEHDRRIVKRKLLRAIIMLEHTADMGNWSEFDKWQYQVTRYRKVLGD